MGFYHKQINRHQSARQGCRRLCECHFNRWRDVTRRMRRHGQRSTSSCCLRSGIALPFICLSVLVCNSSSLYLLIRGRKAVESSNLAHRQSWQLQLEMPFKHKFKQVYRRWYQRRHSPKPKLH